ncbi:hypothetical protein SAMN04489760_11335 [Syntrophus gentianae]|uniref:DUF2846 domain-containing protein n=1 Tax=Syntrophus gentianae TaxID=43775 RepID=A0A1H7Y241_9BACT|nr:hypothetical protein [Syntrophus gentianae]SEM39408.1 hypothetical protein SAMN04489760_11335 [Syntrophus gentianae]
MSFVSSRPAILLAVCVALLFAGCAITPEIAAPPQEQGAALGIGVVLNAKIRMLGRGGPPHEIIFAKLENGSLLGDEIFRSNHIKDGRFYLLNASPGTYAAVAAFQTGGSPFAGGSPMKVTTFFNRDVVEKSRTHVDAKGFAFMGSFDIAVSFGYSRGDEVQTHYRNIISPGSPAKGVMSSVLQSMGAETILWGELYSVEKEDAARSDFLQKAHEDLAGSGWEVYLEPPSAH